MSAGANNDTVSHLRIVRGDPTPEELAAVTALLAAANSAGGSAAEPGPSTVRGGWNDPAQLVRRAWPVGPGGWRSAR